MLYNTCDAKDSSCILQASRSTEEHIGSWEEQTPSGPGKIFCLIGEEIVAVYRLPNSFLAHSSSGGAGGRVEAKGGVAKA